MSPIAINTALFQRVKVNLLQPDDPKAVKSIVQLLQLNAQNNPGHVFCLQLPSKQDDAIGNPISITHLQFYRAVAYCAQRLQGEIDGLHGPTTNEDGTVTKCSPVVLFMESNVGLLIHLLALMSLGVPVAVLSARLSPTAVQHLMSSIRAQSVIASPRLKGTIEEAIAPNNNSTEIEVRMYTQRPFEDDLENSQTLGVAATTDHESHFISENDRNVLILHSSGTTGLPKPIYQPHRYLLNFSECHELGPVDALGTVLSALPLFHGFGLVAPCLAMGAGKPFMLPPSNTIPTGSLIIELTQSFSPTALMTVPHILEEITKLPPEQGVSPLRPLEFVLCGGGPLKISVAETLAAKSVSLLAHFGTTECGPLGVVFVPTPDYDWHYWKLRQDINYRLDEVEANSADENQYKLSVRPFGWDSVFEIQDILISRGAEYKHHLRAVGRKDDLIVLANGEKLVPRVLETLLMQDERVKSAVAFGEGKFEIGVIVESTNEITDEENFKAALWPIVLEAGAQMDSHAQVSSPSSIVLATPEKPIPRSDKGSILRRETYRVYEEEISRVYEILDRASEEATAINLQSDTLEEDLKNLIQREIGWKTPSSEWGHDSDLFDLGMNSLQSMRLHRLLLSSLPEDSRERVGIDFVYRSPSVSKLVSSLRLLAASENGHTHDPEIEIDELIRLNTIIQEEATVLLTGSTGNLGSNLLAHLINLPTVKRVVCLNRRGSDTSRADIDLVQQQLGIAKSKGVIIEPEAAAKIEVMPCDPSADSFGLSPEAYTHLAAQITHILHNAWPMDFKRSLASFQSQFQYLNNLLRLAHDVRLRRPPIRPRFLFVSSIAVVGQYPRTHGTRFIPEGPSDKLSVTDDFGYGKAKYVCEEIIRAAADRYPEMEFGIVRVGQMSGSSRTGYWNPKEHIPTLIKFASMVGQLPDIQQTLSWIPVDSAASVLGDILLGPSISGIYHLENPIRQAWHDILGIFASSLGVNTVNVPFDQWLCNVQGAVQEHGTEDERMEYDMLSNFLEKDFQRMATGRVILDTSRSRAASRILREMGEISAGLVSKYVSEWRRHGTLKAPLQ
ncbi:hypothetical protein BJX96DRAFT_185315 [Aspergillus floccosus]